MRSPPGRFIYPPHTIKSLRLRPAVSTPPTILVKSPSVAMIPKSLASYPHLLFPPPCLQGPCPPPLFLRSLKMVFFFFFFFFFLAVVYCGEMSAPSSFPQFSVACFFGGPRTPFYRFMKTAARTGPRWSSPCGALLIPYLAVFLTGADPIY